MNLTSLLLLNSRHYFGMHPVAPPAGTQSAPPAGWQHAKPATLWQGKPPDSNLALRHGGGRRLASIEAEWDRPDAIAACWTTSPRWAAAGNPSAHVHSAGRVRHYFALSDAPTAKNAAKMTDAFGGGEASGDRNLYSRPPSMLSDGGRYELLGERSPFYVSHVGRHCAATAGLAQGEAQDRRNRAVATNRPR